MRICYVLLSPTFGMHQYTADLANRMVRAGHEVHLVTSSLYRADRYLPEVMVQAIVDTRDTGFSFNAFQPGGVRRVVTAVTDTRADLVHITGPHIWNIGVMAGLQRRGIPVMHTLHDLDPHPGSAYGPLLHFWNRAVVRHADHILLHGAKYGARLAAQGVPATRMTSIPLLHLFLGSAWLDTIDHISRKVRYDPLVLFFGRMERYKGVGDLLRAWSCAGVHKRGARLVLAGQGELGRLWSGPLPAGVELRNRLITDNEAVDLFRRCALLVLPYTGATQSALIAASYFFRKPVIVSRSGVLPEYVQEGTTGWVIEPSDYRALGDRLVEGLGHRDDLAKMGQAGRAWYDEQRAAEQEALLAAYSCVPNRSANCGRQVGDTPQTFVPPTSLRFD